MNLSPDKTSILIATFSPWKNGKRLPINGNVEPLLDFFVPKTKKTVLIDQTYPGSDSVMPHYEVYERKVQKIIHPSWWLYAFYPFLSLVNSGYTHTVFKIRDFLSVVDCTLRDKTTYDYMIGLESINALAGILLRKIGKVRKVIYYVSDYSPARYPQKWFNAIYLWLDRYCAMHADVIWDVSKAMQPARISVGLEPKRSAPVLQVPNALYESQIKQVKLASVIPYSLVFMGTLGVINGPDLAIESLPFIIKKFPKVKLHIIGGGDDDLKRLKQLTFKLGLGKYVIFHGFISDREKISQAIRNYAIALAPYPFIPGSARLYGDATKIRAYLAAGLPTITTHVPPLGKEAHDKGAAVITRDNPKAIAGAVNALFTDKKKYLLLRKKALEFAKENTWENEFLKAFRTMEKMKL